MRNQFIITPVHKNSIYAQYELVRANDDNSTSWLNIKVLYEQGNASIHGDEYLPSANDTVAYCSLPEELPGPATSVTFEFGDNINETEREYIKQMWDNAGTEWMDTAWEREDSYMAVVAPFTVDMCDQDGEIIAENIKLTAPLAVFAGINNQWPVDTTLKENN
jgi:hypothetical protein